MPRQLSFDWPMRVALGVGDFFVTPANERAFARIRAPEGWPEGKLALIGPPGSGKTHLARVFAEAAGAVTLAAADLPETFAPPATRDVVVEDLTGLPKRAEETLFHLHNHLRHTGGRLLMTATRPPALWSISLPDLASRMQATDTVTIDDPDDALLEAVLMKHFNDRQLSPSPALVRYLAPRIERSFAAAARIVARLDAEAMAQGREITPKLAMELLDNPLFDRL